MFNFSRHFSVVVYFSLEYIKDSVATSAEPLHVQDLFR